jgi:uncharacterized protein (DUF1684 family)
MGIGHSWRTRILTRFAVERAAQARAVSTSDGPTSVAKGLTAMATFSEAALQSMKITRAQGEQVRTIWKLLQEDEATWSSNSQHQFVDSDHAIQFERPDVVIKAVLSVVDTVRTSRHN